MHRTSSSHDYLNQKRGNRGLPLRRSRWIFHQRWDPLDALYEQWAPYREQEKTRSKSTCSDGKDPKHKSNNFKRNAFSYHWDKMIIISKKAFSFYNQTPCYSLNLHERVHSCSIYLHPQYCSNQFQAFTTNGGLKIFVWVVHYMIK